MRGKVGAPVLRSKGIEMAIDRMTPHEYKFTAVLSPAAFLQGWTLVLARSSWMGCAVVLHCNREAGGSALPRRLLGTLQQRFSWGDQKFPCSTEKPCVPVSRHLFSRPV